MDLKLYKLDTHAPEPLFRTAGGQIPQAVETVLASLI